MQYKIVTNRQNIIHFFLIFILGFGLYFKSLDNPFVLDDEEQIVLNSRVHSIANIGSLFSASTMNSGGSENSSGIYYKPLMGASYAILWDLFGNQPIAFHSFQLFLHLLNAFLIYLLFCYFMRPAVSLGFALLFLVHPINSENVLYCANLQDVLFLFFGLLATLLNFHALFAKTQRWSKYKSGFFAGLCILLSLLSKESGVLFVFLNLFILVYLKYRKNLTKLKPALTLVFILVPVIFYFYLRIEIANLVSIMPPIVKIGQASLLERFLSLPKIVIYYFSTVIFPVPITLVQDWVVKDLNVDDFILPLIYLFILSFAFYYIFKLLYAKLKNQTAVFGLYFFYVVLILGLGLHSQIVPLDGTVATRWFYFSLLGLFGIFGLGVEYLLGNFSVLQKRNSLIAVILLFIFKIAILSVLSLQRSLEWQNPFEFYKIEAERQPDLYFMQNNFGVELFRKGNVLEASEHFQKATELAPNWSVGWNNLGSALQAKGKLDEAEAAYLKAIELSPYYMAYENYALLLYKRQKFAELRPFLETKALKTFVGNPILSQLQQQLAH